VDDTGEACPGNGRFWVEVKKEMTRNVAEATTANMFHFSGMIDGFLGSGYAIAMSTSAGSLDWLCPTEDLDCSADRSFPAAVAEPGH
jgi:hypothetical protein